MKSNHEQSQDKILHCCKEIAVELQKIRSMGLSIHGEIEDIKLIIEHLIYKDYIEKRLSKISNEKE